MTAIERFEHPALNPTLRLSSDFGRDSDPYGKEDIHVGPHQVSFGIGVLGKSISKRADSRSSNKSSAQGSDVNGPNRESYENEKDCGIDKAAVSAADLIRSAKKKSSSSKTKHTAKVASYPIAPKISLSANRKKVLPSIPTSASSKGVTRAHEGQTFGRFLQKIDSKRNAWKIAGVSEEKKAIYIQNKLKAKEMLRRFSIKEPKSQHEEGHSDQRETRELKVAVFHTEFSCSKTKDEISATQELVTLRQQFIEDFGKLEIRAMKEYENYWAMRIRSINVIPRHILAPFEIDDACSMALRAFSYFRAIPRPLIDYEYIRRMLIITETDWSYPEKLFEIQKMIAKFPKNDFLLVKGTIVHILRLSVMIKAQKHLFSSISKIFAPILFRMPSRSNVVYKEMQYLQNTHAAVFFGNSDQDLNDYDSAESHSYNSLSNWKSNQSSVRYLELQQRQTESATLSIRNLTETRPASTAGRSTKTDLTKQKSSSRMLARSIVSSIRTGIVPSSHAPDVEDLWDGFADATLVGGTKGVPGFRSDDNLVESIQLSPEVDPTIPDSSPFSKKSLYEAAERQMESEAERDFDEWVQLKVAQIPVIGALKITVGRPLPFSQVVNENESYETSELDFSDNGQTPPSSATLTEHSINDDLDFESSSGNNDETPNADYFIAQSLVDGNISSDAMTGLMNALTETETLETETVETQVRENTVTFAVADERQSTQASIPTTGKSARVSVAPPTVFPTHIDFGPGDPDGFGWNFMTKKKLATQLLLEHSCSTATASLLEMMLQNFDSLFDWNMYISSDRAKRNFSKMSK
ncbi:hypothetical protein HDU82_005465 [Entophlyctis luteolus]|nr:hypothetical protein HDU82_005465 [Entophlyctis luteolus]